MNHMSPQRRKVILLACSIAVLQGPGLLLSQHFHNSPYLPAFVISWCILMSLLFAFTVFQLIKLKRTEG